MNCFPVCVAIGSASAIWYSLLVYVGIIAAKSLSQATELQNIFNLSFGVLAVMIAIWCAWMWKSSRGENND